MEVLVVILVALAVSVIALGAKHGAEAAQRRREERWRGFPAARAQPFPTAGPPTRGPAPQASSRGATAAAGVGATQASGAAAQGAQDPLRRSHAAPAPAARSGTARPALRAFRRSDEPAPADQRGEPVAVAARASGREDGLAAPSPAEDARRTAGSAAQNATATARAVRATASAALRRQPAPIDVNTAPASDLQNLPGVGIRAAQRIVAHRESNGPFASVEDLTAVEGFDQHRVSRLAPRATV